MLDTRKSTLTNNGLNPILTSQFPRNRKERREARKAGRPGKPLLHMIGALMGLIHL